ncbi:MAG: hypothetical protein P8N09_08815 [Planctomycetota bacterium]|nr:hypothetical protein [Planctomycetota bacterium]
MAVCLWIGMLQARGEDRGWITSYGGDVLSPLFLQWMFRRTLFACHRWGAEIATVCVLVACFAWEWAQIYPLSGTALNFVSGTFDPYDLLAYSAALATGYALERAARRKTTEPSCSLED